MQFVLYLYLQNTPRSSLKTPMVAAEEYPRARARANTIGVNSLLAVGAKE